MSILFGLLRTESEKVRKQELLELAEATSSWAIDGTFVQLTDMAGMGVQSYFTHERSQLAFQPIVNNIGDMVTLDGRLDNYEDLKKLLDLDDPAVSDCEIILRAFERWGEDCFSRFIGEWAAVIFSNRESALYLARDHAGTRTLFHAKREGRVVWGTYLETLWSGREDQFDEAYLRRYLACLPARELTPYKSIRAVKAAHFVRISAASVVSKRYWQPLAEKEIRYKTDTEYEEHFRYLFRQSVERRTGRGAPILAHLSGGMDSSSIVCMSDYLRREQGRASKDYVDTVSFFDDSEPHWNERPYVSLIEAYRGKAGVHIPSTTRDRDIRLLSERCLLPGSDGSTRARERTFLEHLGDMDYRTILSGVGGDECFGGNPTWLPEIADLLRAMKPMQAARSALSWSTASQQPLLKVLRDSAQFALASYTRRVAQPEIANLPWLKLDDSSLGKSEAAASVGSHGLYRYRPSAIRNVVMWQSLCESLPQSSRSNLRRFEYRYPCLDRDLVDFVFRISRQQLVRPNRRRSLMRRAMRGILPEGIIERKRKAYISLGPLTWFEQHCSAVDRLFSKSTLAEMRVIDSARIRQSIQTMVSTRDFRYLPWISKAIALEIWIQSMNANFVPDPP